MPRKKTKRIVGRTIKKRRVTRKVTKKRVVKRPVKKTIKKTVQKAVHRKHIASIEFCKKCGMILVPIKKGKNTYLQCRSCHKKVKADVRSLKISEELTKTTGVTVLETNTTLLPMTTMECLKCGNGKAYFWLQQTRSADEPPTQFFRCVKCKHTWREYK